MSYYVLHRDLFVCFCPPIVTNNRGLKRRPILPLRQTLLFSVYLVVIRHTCASSSNDTGDVDIGGLNMI